MTTTTSILPDEALIEAANKTLAFYYHLFFTRHKRLSSRPEHFAMAFADMLPDWGVQAVRLDGHPFIHLLVAESIPVRIIMQRWITRTEEQKLQRLMEKEGRPCASAKSGDGSGVRAQQDAESTKSIRQPQAPQPMPPTGAGDAAMHLGLLVQAVIEKLFAR